MADLAAGALDRAGERRDEAARVDGVVGRDLERQPDGRRERRLGAAGLRRAQALDLEPELAAEGEQPVELGGVVRVARDDERAGAPQARVPTGRVAELGAEGLEALGAAQPELEQRSLAEVRLGDRREHPGGDAPRRPRLLAGGVEHGDAQAALGGAPRGREADGAAADDDDVGGARLARYHERIFLPTPALPGSGSTVGGLVPPSQPGVGSRCVVRIVARARLPDCEP